MRREILIEKDVLNVLRDALGVELWPFYCKPKNFGPNSLLKKVGLGCSAKGKAFFRRLMRVLVMAKIGKEHLVN